MDPPRLQTPKEGGITEEITEGCSLWEGGSFKVEGGIGVVAKDLLKVHWLGEKIV